MSWIVYAGQDFFEKQDRVQSRESVCPKAGSESGHYVCEDYRQDYDEIHRTKVALRFFETFGEYGDRKKYGGKKAD